MRVLLLHPEDDVPSGGHAWDLIVDFARAPKSTYQRWSEETACPIISIYDFAKEIDDLGLCRRLLQFGMGVLIDRQGIDWWDVLSLLSVPDLQQLLLVDRLAKHIDVPCELHATRPFALAMALQNSLSCSLTVLGGALQSVRRRMRHYARVLARLDAEQLSQVIQDKFDRRHAVRRAFSRRSRTPKVPVILLPSAYVNVSRMAIRYAELLPEQKFLLVFARRSGKLESLPGNVLTSSLDPYFALSNKPEARLFDDWRVLRQRLVRDESTFEAADRAGMLERVASGLHWGLAVRDAWANVLETECVAGCLCADDSNPYTRIPLLLAKNRGLQTIACHHGALDCCMALKTLATDFYLAKTEMERDYLVEQCHLARERIVLGGPGDCGRLTPQGARERSHIVFFSEPYEASGWRSEEVCRDLAPRLYSLAQSCGLKLAFKLHPFESLRGHRKKLRGILGEQQREIEVIAGPLTDDLWRKTRFALTVESSTALECAARGVPVFLCTWLRDPYAGYAPQYAKFGVGHALHSPEQISDIPRLLENQDCPELTTEKAIDPELLQDLLSANRCLPVAVNA